MIRLLLRSVADTDDREAVDSLPVTTFTFDLESWVSSSVNVSDLFDSFISKSPSTSSELSSRSFKSDILCLLNKSVSLSFLSSFVVLKDNLPLLILQPEHLHILLAALPSFLKFISDMPKHP
uniref:Uncharacterized protein n=1 Tax=Cacopsylla melanoneura TaxID=428564 RepID=A0A8D8PVY0_9HEMI